MVLFSEFYNQVLNTMRSNTIAKMTDEDIMEMLDLMMIRSIAEFRFPRVSLEYEKIQTEQGEEYAFTNEITQQELNVLLALVKKYWLEQQLDNETSFVDLYYDKDVKTYSKANLLKTLNNRYEQAVEQARRAQFDYSRGFGQDAYVGTINE